MIGMNAVSTSGRAALVTGAGRGIGRGIALALAERGWAVAVNYRGNAEAAQETGRAVEAAGGRALLVQANVGLTADRERLLAETLAAFGRLDLLVNNAGMGPRQRVDMLEVAEASYDEVMAVNLKGPFFLAQAAAKTMIGLLKAGAIHNPKIINIGSISAYTASTNRAEYCISKAGVGMLTALLADRLANEGINVYEIRPGIIETDLTSVAKAKYDALIADGLTPIRRWGQPHDVAAAVVAIADGYLPFSTGEVINVDGGFHLRRL
jgi:NAD(P)-dependent dehydrogenase (short-subunit alcohol dehydrogenase family)